jgi:nitrate reductase gamma subunit
MRDGLVLPVLVLAVVAVIVSIRMSSDRFYWETTKRVFQTWRRMWSGRKHP